MSETNSNGFKLPVLGQVDALLNKKAFTRRGFLQAVGATSIATLAAGCHRPEQDTLAPYVTPAEDVVPGNALHYTTSMSLRGLAGGLMVTAYEGRPTKVEGNPRHPWSMGATTLWQQAATMGLYDPGRAHDVLHKGVATSKEALFAALRTKAAELDKTQGAGLRLLLEPSSSPLLGEVLAALKKRWPEAVVRYYSAAASDAVVQGALAAFGVPLHARYDFLQADKIVSFDSDFLAFDAESRYAQDFAGRRSDPEKLSRFYAFETNQTVTGSLADHRFPLKSQDIAAAAHALHARLTGGSAPAPGGLDKQLDAIARDLQASKGRVLFLAGDRMPAQVHAICHALNVALGSVGTAVTYTESPLLDPNIGAVSLRALADEAKAGKVDTLISNCWNPAFARPADIDVAGLASQVKTFVHSGLHEDDTSKLAEWFVPAAHPLESWGDARSADGTVTVVQPLIRPLWNSLTLEELLSGLIDPAPRSGHDMLRERFYKLASDQDPDAYWEKILKQGYVENTALPAVQPNLNAGAVAAAAGTLAPSEAGKVELDLRLDYRVIDGRFGHNPWLLETPDPITKIVWDNSALMSRKTADRFGVDDEWVVRIKAGGTTAEVPVTVVPGHADDAVTLYLGWGLGDAKDLTIDLDPVNVGWDENTVGVNGYPFMTTAAPYTIPAITVEPTDKRYPIAVTQTTFSQHDRDVAMTVDAGDAKAREHIGEELEHLRSDKLPSLYERYPYEKFQYNWAMAVDLSRCTGCSACVVACVSENNIPMVGKDGVRRGREMHWLRIDRYYEDKAENPRAVNQPMACVHCENAPCEYVCPVNATVHNEEGLNEMVYNRCIGTRYCSNNCPYKVRRFNFFAYNNDIPAVVQLGKNPNVTVRSRGVMEKCSYCVQRIEGARINTEINGLPQIRVLGSKVPDDPAMKERAERVPMLQSACQQACPTNAIVFGNLRDPDSVANQMLRDARRFDVLTSLGTRPRTGYLARLLNKNPEIA